MKGTEKYVFSKGLIRYSPSKPFLPPEHGKTKTMITTKGQKTV